GTFEARCEFVKKHAVERFVVEFAGNSIGIFFGDAVIAGLTVGKLPRINGPPGQRREFPIFPRLALGASTKRQQGMPSLPRSTQYSRSATGVADLCRKGAAPLPRRRA